MERESPGSESDVAAGSVSVAEIAATLAEHEVQMAVALRALRDCAGSLAEIGRIVVETLRRGGTILLAGNGGSAAEAQHFAAELVGRFKRDRHPLSAIALTTDSSILTAVANDFCYGDVFARQLEAIGRPGDLFIAYSTSGESENLVRAAETASRRGIKVVAVTGANPNRLAERAGAAFQAPALDTATVQELHMYFTHLICGLAEVAMSTDAPVV